MSSLVRRIQRSHGRKNVVIDNELVSVPIRNNPSTLPHFGTRLGVKS